MLQRLRWLLPATTRFVWLNFSFCLFHTLVFAACIEDGRPNVLSIVFVFAYLCRVFAVIRPNTADVGDSIRRVHLMMMMTICFTEATETTDWRVASSVPTLKPTKHGAEYRILPLPSSSSCLSWRTIFLSSNFNIWMKSTFQSKNPRNQGTDSGELCALILFSHNWFLYPHCTLHRFLCPKFGLQTVH